MQLFLDVVKPIFQSRGQRLSDCFLPMLLLNYQIYNQLFEKLGFCIGKLFALESSKFFIAAPLVSCL